MKQSIKLSLVAASYVAALMIASTAVWIFSPDRGDPHAQASGGMSAFSDSILFVGVLGLSAIAPTTAALFLLRPYPRFWNALSILCPILTVTGVAAAVVFTLGRNLPPSPLSTWAQFSILRLLVTPAFAFAFLICAAFSPQRHPRIAFVICTLIEAAIAVYLGFLWLTPLFFQR